MKRKVSVFICLVISVITMMNCLAVSGTASEYDRFGDLANWQGDLDPDTPITEVNLPGTHDSAMFGISSAPWDGLGFAHNQDKTFEEQLKIGVRYIDGRFCYLDKKNADEMENIFCCHGGYIPEMNDKDISLKDMLNELDKFLEAHPTEFIFFPYKCEKEKDMKSGDLNALLSQIFGQLASENSKRYMTAYRGEKVPTVEEAKGHIIFTPNSNSGIFSDYNTLANNYSNGSKAKVAELSRVFDINNVRKLTKESRIYSPKGENKAESDRSPRLIHTSCYEAPFWTPWDNAEDIRPWILGKVSEFEGYSSPTFNVGYYYGIVLFDYVTIEECRLIVDLNNTETPMIDTDPVLPPEVPPIGSVLGNSGHLIAIGIISFILVAGIVCTVVVIAKNKRKKV